MIPSKFNLYEAHNLRSKNDYRKTIKWLCMYPFNELSKKNEIVKDKKCHQVFFELYHLLVKQIIDSKFWLLVEVHQILRTHNSQSNLLNIQWNIATF